LNTTLSILNEYHTTKKKFTETETLTIPPAVKGNSRWNHDRKHVAPMAMAAKNDPGNANYRDNRLNELSSEYPNFSSLETFIFLSSPLLFSSLEQTYISMLHQCALLPRKKHSTSNSSELITIVKHGNWRD
jgi:hypothetical protein